MLEWLIFGGLVLVGALAADGWYAKRHYRPLSHMRPDPKKMKSTTGMEELDRTHANQKIAKRDK
ncbi:MAG: hypothetical protein OSA51_12360 [Octadecabacter sp.]|nr:hypothetical protein [Octadecabacter sp.]